MIIKEFRIVLPMTVDEYQIGQLWSIAESSRNETGGGDGVQVLVNKSFANHPLLGGQFSSGQYTKKKYFFRNKVNGFIRTVAPKSALILDEEAWNAYPYCKTVVTNEYLGENFILTIHTHHLPGRPDHENVHHLSAEELKHREVVIVDIAGNIPSADYTAAEDPTKFKSKKTGRGPLPEGWMKKTEPIMTAYKLVHFQFKKFGFQNLVEKKVIGYEERLFAKFHRQVFVWIDRWYGLTLDDVRRFEESITAELEKQRDKGEVRGHTIRD